MGFDLSQVDFDALREVDVRTADPDSLVDIKEITIDRELPREQHKVESDSIANQRELLMDYLSSHPEIRLHEVRTDDGYSGVNYDRPGFIQMMEAVKAGEINCIIVKDFSRLGRNFIETGKYIEKRKKGQCIAPFAVYGYRKDEENKNHLVIDEEPAAVVREIFKKKLEGYSAQAIADWLNGEDILSPMEYKQAQGSRYASAFKKNDRASWTAVAVFRILKNERYLGKNVYGKHYRPVVGDYRTKRSSREEWVIVEDCHEAILSSRQEEAQAEQERLEEELGKLEHLVSSGRMEEQTLENYPGMEKLTREMVEAFIDCIYVYNDKSIHIR